MRLMRGFAALALTALATATLACATADGVETQDIVTRIPWQAPETLNYVIMKDEKEYARAQLTIEREGDQLVFSQSFADDEGNTDDSLVVADDTTLKPVSSVRTITDKEARAVAEAQYAEDQVQIREQNFRPPADKTPDDSRSAPLRVGEHSYDNDSSLFIWRTIEFFEDNVVTYTSVLANRRLKQDVTLHVLKLERVKTPAGEFDAWHVEVTAGGRDQEAWFATTDDHTLLVYDNDDLVFLYEGSEK